MRPSLRCPVILVSPVEKKKITVLRILKNQLFRDLKKSWQKTAALGALLIVGLVFWIPPLVKAMVGKSSPPKPAQKVVAAPVSPEIRVETTFKANPTPAETPDDSEFGWQNIDEYLQSDPLVRSAEVAAIQGDPFRIDHDQFPLPVLFAEDSVDEGSANAQTDLPVPPDQDLSDQIVLKSTIIGAKRRAAVINGKFYREGTDIVLNGQTYRLTAVARRKVTLSQGKRLIELRIPERENRGSIQLQTQ